MDSRSGLIQDHSQLVSVIVPIYKVAEYLDSCVRSLTEQTYPDLEIILVDDGSPDDCGAMCDAWAAKDRRIRVVHKKNGGLSDARNAGLQAATGSFVSFIDGDDLVKPDFVEALKGAMEARNAQIAECAVELVGERGGVMGRWKTAKEPVLDKIEGLRRLIAEDGIVTIVCNKLYRREVLEGILFEKGKRHEDEFWTYQVFDRMGRLAVVDRPMYCYRQRGGSIMNSGYSMTRLDGLEARMIRMAHLNQYEQLKDLIHQQLTMDQLWHLQRILRFLEGQERKRAVKIVMDIKKATPGVPVRRLTLGKLFTLFYLMFRIAPKLTARAANWLKIECK